MRWTSIPTMFLCLRASLIHEAGGSISWKKCIAASNTMVEYIRPALVKKTLLRFRVSRERFLLWSSPFVRLKKLQWALIPKMFLCPWDPLGEGSRSISAEVDHHRFFSRAGENAFVLASLWRWEDFVLGWKIKKKCGGFGFPWCSCARRRGLRSFGRQAPGQSSRWSTRRPLRGGGRTKKDRRFGRAATGLELGRRREGGERGERGVGGQGFKKWHPGRRR